MNIGATDLERWLIVLDFCVMSIFRQIGLIIGQWRNPKQNGYPQWMLLSLPCQVMLVIYSFVERDSEGLIQGCGMRRIVCKVSVLQCELEAILEGMMFARRKNWSHVVLESDSLIAVREINKQGDSLCE